LSRDGLVGLGFNNVVVAGRVIAIVSASAAPIKRLKDEARKLNKLVDATQGRKTRAVVITDSDHVILSSSQPETIIDRMKEIQS
jgi:extracellular matrix regulatory protein A